MTIRQVLRKNNNVSILDDCFRIFTVPYNNFLFYCNGEVGFFVDTHGEYKAAIQKAKEIINKMPSTLPTCLQQEWTFSQSISDDEAEELNRFLSQTFEALD